MNLPRRRTRPKMGLRQSSVVRCPAHLQFVRGFRCSIEGKGGHTCEGKIVAAHVRTGTNGSMGKKPGDEWTISLCWWAHLEQHRIGEAAFEREYEIDMKAIAEKLAARSKHLKRMASANRTEGKEP